MMEVTCQYWSLKYDKSKIEDLEEQNKVLKKELKIVKVLLDMITGGVDYLNIENQFESLQKEHGMMRAAGKEEIN